MFSLRLRRFAYTPFGTFGDMTITGIPFNIEKPRPRLCYTLEPNWKHNEPFVSCIPCGTYELQAKRYNKGGYDTFEIMDVPGRDNVLIHIGNDITDTQGCPLVGSNLGWLNGKRWGVIQSADAFGLFKQQMNLYKPNEIIISNNFGGNHSECS